MQLAVSSTIPQDSFDQGNKRNIYPWCSSYFYMDVDFCNQVFGRVKSMFAEQMKLHSVYFTQWSPPELTNGKLDVRNAYHRLVDSSSSTCEDMSGREFINVVWSLPRRETTNYFRVYMNGSQQCLDINAVWFTSGGKSGSVAVQCGVTQQNNTKIHVCDIQYLCHVVFNAITWI